MIRDGKGLAVAAERDRSDPGIAVVQAHASLIVSGTGRQALSTDQSPQGYPSRDGIHPTTQADQNIARLAAESVAGTSPRVRFVGAIAVIAARH